MFRHCYGLSVNFNFDKKVQKLHKFVLATPVYVCRIFCNYASLNLAFVLQDFNKRNNNTTDFISNLCIS